MKDVSLTLSNAQGSAVFTMKLPVTADQYSNSMNIERFPAGIYYMKASSGASQVIRKVVIQ